MKILMINKFLHPNGGSETYIFKLGEGLTALGHEVQYFGMEHEGRIVGNRVNAYTTDMDFHGGSKLAKLTYPIKTIYSTEARKKIRLVLDDFRPDVCHLNNFNYQLTPSVILEIRRWEKKSGKKCKIVFTAHDGQLVCPNHLMQNPVSGETCTKCLEGSFLPCINGRCIHGSLAKSAVGAAEGWFWKTCKVYRQIDAVISPSHFLAEKLSANPFLKGKIRVIHNFIETQPLSNAGEKGGYVLFYGRYSKEKGIHTLLNVVDQLPHIPFVFAGDGPLKKDVDQRSNIVNKGFLSGGDLAQIVSGARFTVIPSECFENCPFTVMESQMYGTPVLGAEIGGIPELIQVGKTGELFESGNARQLREKIEALWDDSSHLNDDIHQCAAIHLKTVEQYVNALMQIYV